MEERVSLYDTVIEDRVRAVLLQKASRPVLQMSAQIYVEVVSAKLREDATFYTNPELMRSVASDSLQAARCYFEGIGVLKVAE